MKQFLFAAAALILCVNVNAQDKKSLAVHFDFDKFDLKPEAISSIDSFLSTISKSDIISLQLSGHCDSKGTGAYNDALSLKRVNVVKDFLEQDRMFSAGKITANAYGEKNLLNSDATEQESYANRRVEIVATFQATKPVVVEEKKEEKTLSAIVADTSTKVGATITLPNLNFENNSDILLPASTPTLKELLSIMERNPSMRIAIEGHICCVEKIEGLPFERWPNYQISLLRAKMVYDYLLKNGVNENRMSYTAFGSSRPVFPIPERTEEQRIANRRVEIRIIEK